MHLVRISRFNEETNHGTLKHHDIWDDMTSDHDIPMTKGSAYY